MIIITASNLYCHQISARTMFIYGVTFCYFKSLYPIIYPQLYINLRAATRPLLFGSLFLPFTYFIILVLMKLDNMMSKESELNWESFMSKNITCHNHVIDPDEVLKWMKAFIQTPQTIQPEVFVWTVQYPERTYTKSWMRVNY